MGTQLVCMQKAQNHIIYSKTVELEFYNREENLFIQNHIAGLVKDKLLPAMETLFDAQTASGKTIKIESLELDLGKLNQRDWEYDFVNETIYQLRQKLNEIVSFSTAAEVYEVSYKDDQPLVNNIQSADEAINRFNYFLQRGTLPWNASQQSANDLLNIILEAAKRNKLSGTQKRKISGSIFYADETLKRFLLQFTDAYLSGFLEHVLQVADATQIIGGYYKIITEHKALTYSRVRTIAWLMAFLHHYSENEPGTADHPKATIVSILNKEFSTVHPQVISNILDADTKLKALLQQHEIGVGKDTQDGNSSSQQQTLNEPTKFQKQNKKPIGTSSKEYFINNAGLIILSPFLKQMFINLGLGTAKEFVSEEARQHAVLLSQYLITGETEIAEHALLLNKILCGYPVDKTLPSTFKATEEEKKQCHELLQSVLEYWKELKTTKPGSLLNTYILRNGKLVDKGEYWLMQVEYKAVDIMLQFLPWSIGIIYFPWMQKRLMVEWRA